MKRHPKSSYLLDRMHKGFVCTCIAVTIYGFSMMGTRLYRYLTLEKPLINQKKLLDQQLLLAEGSSDILTDTAPSIS